jgi:hypothetical protein
MEWGREAFGERTVRDARVILPTEAFFPDSYDGSDAAAERMFDRVCAYTGIERSRVRLALVTGRHDNTRGGALFIKADGGGAAGTYQQGEVAGQKVELITLERSTLRDPVKAVATMAHELCHVHLLGGGKVSHEEEDHEPLTDLLTICLGLGIFGANACVRDRSWSDSQMSGWEVSTLGYLRQETWAYALATFASMRGEDCPAWGKYLRADVRAAFKASQQFLAPR